MNTPQTEKAKIKIKWKYIKGKEYERVLSLFIDYNTQSTEFEFGGEKFEIIWQGSDYSLLLMKEDMDREKGVYIISDRPLEIWKKETVARTLLKRHPELIQKL